MAIKLVTKSNVSKLPKNRWTMKEALELFLKRCPKDEKDDVVVLNAIIVYQTDIGFSHATLHFDNPIGLVGVMELAKAHLVYEYLSAGDIRYGDSDEGDEDDE